MSATGPVEYPTGYSHSGQELADDTGLPLGQVLSADTREGSWGGVWERSREIRDDEGKEIDNGPLDEAEDPNLWWAQTEHNDRVREDADRRAFNEVFG